jgi:hypothetical protein
MITQNDMGDYVLTAYQLSMLLRNAAEEGLRVGKLGTEGDHTIAGIDLNVFMDALHNGIDEVCQWSLTTS